MFKPYVIMMVEEADDKDDINGLITVHALKLHPHISLVSLLLLPLRCYCGNCINITINVF